MWVLIFPGWLSNSVVSGFRMDSSAFDGTPGDRWLKGQSVGDVHVAQMPGFPDSDRSVSILMVPALGQARFSHGNLAWIKAHPFQSGVQTWGRREV